MSIGKNIRTHRLEKGISQKELAMRSRISIHKLEKFENNEAVPSLQVILNLSSALECPASDLIEQIQLQGSPHMDEELHALIQEIGLTKAKLILRKMKDIEENESMLHEDKYEPIN